MAKFNSIWPMPGGVENYFNALLIILDHIDQNTPTRAQMMQAMKELFPSMSADSTIKPQLLIPQHMDLVKITQDKLQITEAGKELLRTKDKIQAYRILSRTHMGFDELFLKLAETPLGTKEIHSFLQKEVNPKWTHLSQPACRVNWLRSLGLVQKDGTLFQVTDQGLEVAREINSVPEENAPSSEPDEPTPVEESAVDILVKNLLEAGADGGKWQEFEDLLAQAFEFLGYTSQKIGGAGEPDVVITADLGSKSYSAVVDAKASSGKTIAQSQIDFDSIQEHRAKMKADYMAVVGIGFAGGNVATRAKEKGVCLTLQRQLK